LVAALGRRVVDRRAWLGGILGLLATPGVAVAQSAGRVSRIGILAGSGPATPEAAHLWESFFEGLRELGYVEGRNVVVESRWYGNAADRATTLAAELVRLSPDVLVVGTTPAPEAAKRATSTIPIVMLSHPDPVASGLVASLARPEGNVTGLSSIFSELRGKQLQLLMEIVPGLARVAVLSNPAVPAQALDLKVLRAAAESLKVRLQVVEARAPGEFAGAFSAATKERAGAIIVLAGSVFFTHRAPLVELAARHRLVAMYTFSEFVAVGGLVAYGVDLRHNWRRGAWYVDRILRGAKPSDLPVEQSTKLELMINLRTAKTLGLTMPPSVLARADHVIE
jgi:putative ABC transport system substrate-binding protein